MEVDTHTLIELIDAAMSADYTRVRRTGNLVAKKLLEAKDAEGAKLLQGLLRKKGVPLQASGYAEALPRDSASRLPLIEEGVWPTKPLFLNSTAGETISRFLEDCQNVELLSSKGISTRLGLLLHGAPGTGKSMLAAQMAAHLQIPIYIVRLDSLISSRLGDTAKNIRNVFDFIPSKRAVLFLDEIDAVAKIRDDKNEMGELKRVVNTVLQGLDSLDDDTVVIAATNHPHLLDPAIWRRFPYKIELDVPDQSVRTEMWSYFLFEEKIEHHGDSVLLANVSKGLSGADIENISLSVRRRTILDGETPSLNKILMAVMSSRSGSPSLLEKRPLSHEDKRSLTIFLHEKCALEVTNIARIVGVSRQMVYKYLKELNHGN